MVKGYFRKDPFVKRQAVQDCGALAHIALGVDELGHLCGKGHGLATRVAQLMPRHSRLSEHCPDTYVQVVLQTLEAPDV
jgi:hypothetical protein